MRGRIVLASLFPLLLGCTQLARIDAAMGSAHRAAREPSTFRGYRVLAGDMHCHVRPPDADWDVVRELPETARLAEAEGLDFVVLTPHVRARFFQDPDERARVERGQTELRARIATMREGSPDVLFIPGFEYTDHAWGHANASFADVRDVLAEVSVDDARAHPEHFFERFVARGGVLVINHPVFTPVETPFSATSADISWRGFFGKHPPPEMQAVQRLSSGVEVFNLPVTHLRDGLLLDREERSLRMASVFADRLSRERGGPIASVGGSDSHGHHLRATTFVLARDRTPEAIRDAVVNGRTCARDPAACTLEVSADGRAWSALGDAVSARDGVLHARARGDDVTYFVNGVPSSGPTLQVSPCACSIVRARVGKGWSSGIRVNCRGRT